MEGVIAAPRKIITGAFSVLFTFVRGVDLTRDGVQVETLEGDALGHPKDSFGGSGVNYYMLCYLPDERQGRSRISVSNFAVPSVVVEYDTLCWLTPVWGVPFQRNGHIEIPITFPQPIRQLKKRNFTLSRPLPFQIYGSDAVYSVVIPGTIGTDPFTITVSGIVWKASDVRAEIRRTVLEVA